MKDHDLKSINKALLKTTRLNTHVNENEYKNDDRILLSLHHDLISEPKRKRVFSINKPKSKFELENRKFE